jgi:hypothetical protein
MHAGKQAHLVWGRAAEAGSAGVPKGHHQAKVRDVDAAGAGVDQYVLCLEVTVQAAL